MVLTVWGGGGSELVVGLARQFGALLLCCSRLVPTVRLAPSLFLGVRPSFRTIQFLTLPGLALVLGGSAFWRRRRSQ